MPLLIDSLVEQTDDQLKETLEALRKFQFGAPASPRSPTSSQLSGGNSRRSSCLSISLPTSRRSSMMIFGEQQTSIQNSQAAQDLLKRRFSLDADFDPLLSRSYAANFMLHDPLPPSSLHPNSAAWKRTNSMSSLQSVRRRPSAPVVISTNRHWQQQQAQQQEHNLPASSFDSQHELDEGMINEFLNALDEARLNSSDSSQSSVHLGTGQQTPRRRASLAGGVHGAAQDDSTHQEAPTAAAINETAAGAATTPTVPSSLSRQPSLASSTLGSDVSVAASIRQPFEKDIESLGVLRRRWTLIGSVHRLIISVLMLLGGHLLLIFHATDHHYMMAMCCFFELALHFKYFGRSVLLQRTWTLLVRPALCAVGLEKQCSELDQPLDAERFVYSLSSLLIFFARYSIVKAGPYNALYGVLLAVVCFFKLPVKLTSSLSVFALLLNTLVLPLLLAANFLILRGQVVEAVLSLTLLLFYSLVITTTTFRLIEENLLLRESRLQLERANEDKSMLVSALSHETRSPLFTIAGSTELLRTSPDARYLTSEQKNLLNSISSASNILLSLVNDIIFLNKLEEEEQQQQQQQMIATPADLVSDEVIGEGSGSNSNATTPAPAPASASSASLLQAPSSPQLPASPSSSTASGSPDAFLYSPVQEDIWFNFDDCLSVVRTTVDKYALQVQVRIKFVLGDVLKKYLTKGLIVRGDITKVQQLLINLLCHSCSVSPKNDTVDMYMEIQHIQEASSPSEFSRATLLCEVEDRGLGVSLDKAHMMWVPFAHLHSETHVNNRPTSGLGLPICRAIVRSLGGTIEFSSSTEAADHGTTFFVQLPIVFKQSREQAGSSQSASASAASPSSPPLAPIDMSPEQSQRRQQVAAIQRTARRSSKRPNIYLQSQLEYLGLQADEDEASLPVSTGNLSEPVVGQQAASAPGQVSPTRSPDSGSTPTTASSLSSLSAASTPAKPPVILLAEDNLINRQIMVRFLERQGLGPVKAVVDGQDALDELQRREGDSTTTQFKVLVTDLHMPRVDGAELSRQARTKYPGIKIVLVTADASVENTQGDGEVFYDKLLTKPIASKQLCDIVQGFLDNG